MDAEPTLQRCTAAARSANPKAGVLRCAARAALVLAQLTLVAVAGCSSDDSSQGANGGTSQAGCTAGSDCSGCTGCMERCVCETGQAQSCATACGAAGTGGGSGGSGAVGGSGATGGSAGSGAAGSGGVAGTGGGPVDPARDPVIPPVNGECPTFTNQTLDFMSLRGIQMQAGPRSEGTGILLFYWHGTGSNAGEVGLVPQTARQTILDSGGIIVSPQSSTGSTDGLVASGTSIWFAEDLATVDQIVACAVRDHGIDPRRIYATGCSAGGLFTGYLTAQRSQYIAASAPNSGGALGQSFAGATHIPPVMTMHGAAGVDVVVLDFAEQSLQFTALVVSSGGFAIDCNHAGRHCSAPGDLYGAAMKFLFDHPFGVSPEPYASGLPAGFPAYCQIQ